jgi:hypothetical protein
MRLSNVREHVPCVLGFETFLYQRQTKTAEVRVERPFRGLYFFTYDAVGLTIENIRVGNTSCFPAGRSPVPAEHWAAPEHGMLLVTDEASLTTYKLAFPVAAPGVHIIIDVRNAGYGARLFRAAIFGYAIREVDYREVNQGMPEPKAPEAKTPAPVTPPPAATKGEDADVGAWSTATWEEP